MNWKKERWRKSYGMLAVGSEGKGIPQQVSCSSLMDESWGGWDGSWRSRRMCMYLSYIRDP